MAKYKLLKAQEQFLEVPHSYKRDIAVYQGGYGSGKTWCGSLLGILLARKYPGCVGLVGAKEYELLKNTTMVEYFNHLDGFGYKKGKHYKYNKTDKIITFNNGSKILFKGLDDPEKIKSLNLHWAEIEEMSQVKDASFKQVLARLRATAKPEWEDFKYRLFGHTNPQPDKGWVYTRFVEKKEKDYRIIFAPTSENIYLPEHFVESLKGDYDPEYFRINVLGEFGDYASGLIVKNFTDENIRHLAYNKDVPLHITCDFNVDPMCWVLAHKDDKSAFFFDEIVIENTTTSKTIAEFIRRYPDHESDIIINGDASGDNRNVASEYTNYIIMRKALIAHGYDPKKIKFALRKFNPLIKNRVHAFNAKVKNASGGVNLFVDKKCKWFLYNIHNLKYKPGTSDIDTPTHHQLKSERESKFLGHPFDAGSYLIEYYFPVQKLDVKEFKK